MNKNTSFSLSLQKNLAKRKSGLDSEINKACYVKCQAFFVFSKNKKWMKCIKSQGEASPKAKNHGALNFYLLWHLVSKKGHS